VETTKGNKNNHQECGVKEHVGEAMALIVNSRLSKLILERYLD